MARNDIERAAMRCAGSGRYRGDSDSPTFDGVKRRVASFGGRKTPAYSGFSASVLSPVEGPGVGDDVADIGMLWYPAEFGLGQG